MTVLSLASELALIALDGRGQLAGNEALETALAGAWIVELLERGRIALEVEVAEPSDERVDSLAADIGLASDAGGVRTSVRRRLSRHRLPSALTSTLDDEWITVVDSRSTGMPDVDLALTWLASPDRRSLTGWLAVLGQYNASGRVLAALESARVVRASGRRRNPFAPGGWDVLNKNPERDLRERLERIVAHPDGVAVRDVCLLRLVETCALEYALWRTQYPQCRRQVDRMPHCRVDAAVRRVVDRNIAAH